MPYIRPALASAIASMKSQRHHAVKKKRLLRVLLIALLSCASHSTVLADANAREVTLRHEGTAASNEQQRPQRHDRTGTSYKARHMQSKPAKYETNSKADPALPSKQKRLQRQPSRQQQRQQVQQQQHQQPQHHQHQPLRHNEHQQPQQQQQQQKQQQQAQPQHQQQQQQPQQQQQHLLQQAVKDTDYQRYSPQASIINGWDNLRTSASTTFTWSQSSYPLTSTTFTVPWGWGTAIAKIRSSYVRSVASASYTFSGNLGITNPDPSLPAFINRVQLQCLWGANVDLPCSNTNNGWRYGGMLIGAGQMAYCYVSNLPVQAVWGGNYGQPCKVVATTWSGIQSSSGDFTLDFSNPAINNQANNCISISAICSVYGAPYYLPTVGSLPTGQFYCDSNVNFDYDVAVSGGFIGDGLAPGACGSAATISCYTQGTYQSTIGVPPSPGGSLTATPIQIQVTPNGCPAPPPPPTPKPPANPNPPGPPPGFSDRPEPQLTISVTKTYITGAFLWSATSSVNPNSLQMFQDSSSTVRYSVNVFRKLAGSPVPVHSVEGVVLMHNPTDQPISVKSVSAVLPAGITAAATCQGLKLPGILNPSVTVSCSYKLNQSPGMGASTVSAQALLQNSATPVQSSASADFNFGNADLRWSTGRCAGVSMSFSANAKMALGLVAGGRAPTFAGSGDAPTEVCADSTPFEFTVQMTAGIDLAAGNTQVLSTVSVSPDNSNQGIITANSAVDITVLQWPATWGAKVQAQSHRTITAIPLTVLADKDRLQV